MATFFDTNKYSSSTSTADWMALGHDGDDAMIIGGSGKLILSASNGQIHASGAITIGLEPENKNYSIRAVNTPLILSSSTTSIVALSASMDLLNTDKAYHVRSNNSHLILSSTVGSVVAVSSSMDFVNSDKAYHFRAVNSYLILSSSVGSVVYISGSLRSSGSVTITGSVSINDGLSSSVLSFPVDAVSKLSHIRANNSHLIFSSSVGSVIYISGSLRSSGSVTITGSVSVNDGLSGSTFSFPVDAVSTFSHVRANSSHLVLSSSVGSLVRISSALGALNTTTADLPGGDIPVFSGAIMWDTTRKCLRVYSAEGWVAIATGSAA